MDVQNGGSDSLFKMYSMNVSTGAGHTNDYGNGGNIKVKTDQTGEIRIRIASGYTANNLIFKPKIEKGTVAKPWSQHGQGCIKVTKCNKNIFKETYNRKDLTSAYFSIVKGEGFLEKDKTYVISFDTTNNGGIVYLGESSFQHINTFTVKCDGTRKFFTAKAKEFGYVTDITVLKTRAVTTNAYNISNVMINEYENDTDIDYVQHEEQSYIIPTQQPMRSVGNIRDTFIKTNGKWYERHYIARKIFDGTEDWIKSSNTNVDRFVLQNSIDYGSTEVCCNYLRGNELFSNTNYNKNKIFLNTYNSTKRWIINYTDYNTTTLKDFKTWLAEQYNAGTPVYVDYILETPTDIECTEEQSKILDELSNARTYKNVTNITTDSKAILSLDYFAVTDEKIKNEGNIQSRPLLRLEKTVSEAVELTINNVRFKYNFKNEEYVEIDCENKEVKFEGLDRFRNIEIGYEFPKLNVGENKIVMHSGDCIIKVLRKDRWL